MEGTAASYKHKGKALASAAEESKNEGLVCPRCFRAFTTVLVKQPTTTQADYGKDGNDDLIEDDFDLIEVMNNDDKKKRNAENESDKVAVKQKKQVIDLNREPPESSQDTYYPNISDSGGFVKEQTKISPVLVPDLNNPLPLKQVIDLNSEPPGSSQDTYYPNMSNNDNKKKRKAEGESDKVPVKQKKQMIDLNKKPVE